MSRTTSAGASVVVIGAGVIGASIALELSRAGRRVTVIDKAGAAGHGSTSASSAIVRFNYSTLPGVSLAWESLHAWNAWEDHLAHRDPAGLARYHRTGSIVLGRAGHDWSRITDLFDQVSVPWEVWSEREIAGRLPFLDAGYYGPPKPVEDDAFFDDATGPVSGLYTPDSGFVDDPQLAAHNLAAAAERHGAAFLLRHEVTGIRRHPAGHWTVTTGGTAVEADIVVNAAGPWSSQVNALAGVGAEFAVRSRPLRQEVHQVRAPRGFADGAHPGIAIADPGLGIYVNSTVSDDSIIVGGTEPECDPLEWVEDPDAVNVYPTVKGFTTQVTRAARRLPGLGVPGTPAGLAGVYDATTDWSPIYDRTAAEGFYVAMGTSGNQFKNAPSVGRLMTALIDAVEAGADHDAEPVRFTGPRTGLPIDLGQFSRLRAIRPDAPVSVLG